MNPFSLLCVVFLLINCSQCGLDIFEFTSEPKSQTINSGGSVTLSCVATGRNVITYSWYKLAKDFSIPPTDLINGATTTKYVVQATDVDDSGEKNMFQCKATAGSDYIFSNVSTVKFSLQDNIKFSGTIYSSTYTTDSDPNEDDVIIYKISCYKDTKVDMDKFIDNGKPYDIFWFKDTENKRVEETYKNMWTYYNKGTTTEDLTISIEVGGNTIEKSLDDVKPYDLVIYNAQTSDSGTYTCKAVSRGDQNTVTLATATLTVTGEFNNLIIKSKDVMGGYTILAVDNTGKRKSVPNVGDEVLLMCGAACKTSTGDGGWDIQYTWKELPGGTVIPNETTNTITVTPTSSGQKKYRCEINAGCLSSSATKTFKEIQFTVTAEFDPLQFPFTFSTTPPKYMWYISDSSKSHDPFEINCDGSVSSDSFSFLKAVYKDGAIKVAASSYTFPTDVKSEESGVYQCALYNNPNKVAWYQKTTNVVIVSPPTATISPTSPISVQDGTIATFTCTVTGNPIKSVTITGPDNVNLDCPKTIGDVACSATNSENVITVARFNALKSGTYTCTVQTEWYKTNGGANEGASKSDTINLEYVKASTTVLFVSSVSPKKGDSVTLTCVVEGYPEPIKPTLEKSGLSIDWTSCTGSNRKECTKTFSSSTYSDSGNYKCKGSNTIGGSPSTSEDDLKLDIVGDVEVTLKQNPTGTELGKSSSVTFICKAEGNPRPTKLTFKRGTTEIKSYDSASGTDTEIVANKYDISYTKTINSLKLDDTGKYTCEGENNNGGVKTDEKSKTVTVVSDVTVAMSSTPQNKVPTLGTALTVTCTVTGGRKPHSVELKQNSLSLKSYPADTSFCTNSGSYTLECTYSITSTDFGSGGSYECTGKNKVANNDERTTKSSIDISISQAVAVTMTPSSDTEVSVGNGFTITCNVKGGDQPHKVTLTKPDTSVLTWERSGSSASSLFTCTGTFELTCKYEIKLVAYSNEGDYKCEGFNKLPGESTDKTAHATVKLIPVKDVSLTLTKSITSSLDEVEFGTDLKITCVADGGRIPYYLDFSQTPKSSSAKQIILYDTESSKTPTSVAIDQDANTLTYVHTVTSAGYDNIGEYSCLAKNKATSSAVKSIEKKVKVVVVNNVTSKIDAPGVVKKTSALMITCVAEGYRPPHSITLTKDGQLVVNWVPASDSSCTEAEFYKFQCVHTISETAYLDGGNYKCIGKNSATGNKEVVREANKTVQISQTVLTKLTPNSEKELKWGDPSLTFTCNIEGAHKPHKATLEVPDGSIYTWNRIPVSGSPNSLTCNGENVIECVRNITSSDYSSTGTYKCTGYNKIPSDSTVHKMSKVVNIIVVKDVEATMTSDPGSSEVDFGTTLNLTCKVEGGRIPFFLSTDFTDVDGTNHNIIKFYKTYKPDKVTQTKSYLQYIHVIESLSYRNNGLYTCSGKNYAYQKQEKRDNSAINTVVVKDVEITQAENIETDYGKSFTFTINVNGGREPHIVTVTSENSQILDKSQCIGTNELTCTKIVQDNDVNFGYAGKYTVTAKNKARKEAEITATKDFDVTVYRDVSAMITPSSNSDITYHVNKTITCELTGGLPPHKVDLILPKQKILTWNKDDTAPALTCTGKTGNHELTCSYTFKPEYDSDGEYKCKGYNKVRGSAKEKESSVTLTTVRKTEVINITSEKASVLTNGVIKISCTIVGKPLVPTTSVTWKHEKDSLTLDEFVKTVESSEDKFTLKSTLTIQKPNVTYSGNFICTATDNGEAVSKSTKVLVNNREFLEDLKITHSAGDSIQEGFDMSVTCVVKGFPPPSASLVYSDINGTLSETIDPSSSNSLSKTSMEFEFKLQSSCEFTQYRFECKAQTRKNSGNKLLEASASVDGPKMLDCGGLPLAAVIGGGVGGGVFVIVIIVIAVLFILKRAATAKKERSYAPQNGTQIPNPAFSPDPSYATINDQGRPGYSHLNRPVGDTTEDGYSSIGQMKQNVVPVIGNDAYATLDTNSNSRLGHQRKGSDEVYNALNRPAPGKETRGVIRKYKPLASRPKPSGKPTSFPLAGDIEMGETSHSSQAEPTYATVNPDTMKSKTRGSEYADVTLPDIPPEIPIYGQNSRQPGAIPSEYADVTRGIPSEYADVTLDLPPPPLPSPPPEEPQYSNMGADRQDPLDIGEDPVYAQVDLKTRTGVRKMEIEETEDLPPEVPVYGTMGELTEPYNPADEEDPYATVEFVPKTKRKPPKPKVKENDQSEGVYATITDLKENS